MRTQALYQPYINQAAENLTENLTGKIVQHGKENSLISELVYDKNHNMIFHLLVPLLQQLGKQSRWLLWLTPQQKLSKTWLQQVKLPVNKTVQLNQIDPMDTVDAMARALLTGNYSVVLGWLPEITEADRIKLGQAAIAGKTYAFIMRPQQGTLTPHRHCYTLKIHSSLYH